MSQKKAGWVAYSPAEIDILKEHYEAEGPRAILARLPGRRYQGVATFARSLGLKCDRKVLPKVNLSTWSDEEEAVLRKHYPKGGPKECLKHLPGRNYRQVTHRARRLKLKAPRGKTPEQLAALERAKVEAQQKKYQAQFVNFVHKWRTVGEWVAEPVKAPRSIFEVTA